MLIMLTKKKYGSKAFDLEISYNLSALLTNPKRTYVMTPTLPCKIKVKNTAYTNTVIYEGVQTCVEGYERIFGDFQSYRLENKSIWVVFRVEFDGDIRFCVAPPKSMVLLIFIDFFRCFP